VTDNSIGRGRIAAVVARALREPLVHFLALGLVLVLGVSLYRASTRPAVQIDAREIGQLAAYWEAQMQRPPNAAELKGIIDDRINEEVLAREAMRLGLDKDDMIIRRRLAQKMAFASDGDGSAPPTDAQLRAYFDANRTAYVSPPQVTFQHVFFNADRSKDEALQRASLALKLGGVPKGDPFLLPLSYAEVSTVDLGRDYGVGFEKALETAPVGQWIGPVASGYGYHLIRIDGRIAGKAGDFAAVRSEVLAAYQEEHRKASQATFLAKLRERYKVRITGVPQTVLSD
jgi:peptidyl-prolyl cis-trans isomerase C